MNRRSLPAKARRTAHGAGVATVLGLVVLCGPAAADRDLDRLVGKADRVLRGTSSAAVLNMQVKTEDYTRAYSIVSWDVSKGKERTLIKILGPALWRGHGTLKVGDQLKLFNPRTNHVTVVGSSMLGDSWMGSHFTNDDLVKETKLDEHFDEKLVKKWESEAGDGKAATFYKVDLTPRPTAPVAWGRITYTLLERGEVVLPTRAEYYRKAGDSKPQRTLTFSDIEQMGGRTVPTRLRMTVARKPGEYTELKYKRLKFGVDIPQSKFTEQALRR